MSLRYIVRHLSAVQHDDDGNRFDGTPSAFGGSRMLSRTMRPKGSDGTGRLLLIDTETPVVVVVAGQRERNTNAGAAVSVAERNP